MSGKDWRGRKKVVDLYSEIPISKLGYSDEEARGVQGIVNMFMNSKTYEDTNKVLTISDQSVSEDNANDKMWDNSRYTYFDKFLRILVDNGSKEEVESIVNKLIMERKIKVERDGDPELFNDLAKVSPELFYKIYSIIGEEFGNDKERFLKRGIEYWDSKFEDLKKDIEKKDSLITKLQEMLNKALTFAQRVKESTVGKVFFKRQIKELGVVDNKLLPENSSINFNDER